MVLCKTDIGGLFAQLGRRDPISGSLVKTCFDPGVGCVGRCPVSSNLRWVGSYQVKGPNRVLIEDLYDYLRSEQISWRKKRNKNKKTLSVRLVVAKLQCIVHARC